MSLRQQPYDQRFTIGPENPASSIERQDVQLDTIHTLTVQWLETGELRLSVWNSSTGIRKRFTSTVLSAVDGAAFLQTLTERQPE